MVTQRDVPWLSGMALALLAGCSCDSGPVGPGTDAGLGREDAPAVVDAPASELDAPRLDGALSDAAVEPDAAALDAGPRECPLPPACDAPYPDLGATSSWRHSIATPITVGMGAPRHRGRDLFLTETDPQWALAKFAYGVADDDLKDEDVDLYLDRGCSGAWEMLGTAATTNDGDHATVEGVEDTGGRIFFEIPSELRLEPGRHRVLFVVRGDHSVAEQWIDVLPASTRFVVTDVDGTQTESETAAWASLLTGSGPAAQPHGAEALHAFARRGYRIFYLTARPEWLEARTHEWLVELGYPPGLVHTTLGFTGATEGPAETFKTEELAALEARFPGAIAWGIGNTRTDAASYVSTGLPADHIVSYRFDGAGATRMDDYAELVTIAEGLPAICE
ncbi:MAG: phosphatidylinositol transfer protein [Sandaracinaceae bacterium]|nr:phosphatidylinositol transfer protein [Sandaracinaceae bacterium]